MVCIAQPAKEIAGLTLPSEEELFAVLDEVLASKLHSVNCRKAYKFRRLPTGTVLKAKIRQKNGIDWEHVNHLIGRLGSWHRAALFLVQNASNFRQTLRDVIVKLIPVQDFMCHGTNLSRSLSLTGVVSRVWSRSEDRNTAKQLAPRQQWYQDQVSKIFPDGPPKTSVLHAEAMVACHFYINGMDYAYGDSYIGCSKPSCFGCKAYLESPELALKARPSSGNAFASWFPPIAVKVNADLSDDKMTRLLMHSVADRISDEVVRNLWNERTGRARRHDSTTGITTTDRNAVRDP
jgi:hypothetical protein